MKRRDLIIVLAVLAFGVIYNFIESGEVYFSDGCSSRRWGLQDMKHPNSFPRPELRYADSGIREIEFDNTAGGIEVVKSIGNEIRIQPEVRVFHRDRGEATELEKEVIITPTRLKEDNGRLRITVKTTEDFNYRRLRVYFKVSIPETVELDILNRYGDVTIDGCGKNVCIDNIQGDVLVKHVSGDLKIQHKHGKLVVRNITGAVELNSSFSRISVTEVTAVKLNCSHADAYLNQVKQETTVEYAAFSDIKFETGNGFIFDGKHTGLRLKNIKNGVKISDSHSSIRLEDITGNIDVQANNCRVRMTQVLSDEVAVNNEFGDVSINDVAAKKIAVQLSHGNLDIDFTEITEQVSIKNSYSRIRLFYPKAIQPSFNIDLSYGEIKNNTDAKFTLVTEENRVRLTHTVGAPKITIENSYDDIHLSNNSATPTQKIIDSQSIQPTQPSVLPTQKVETEEFKKIEETQPTKTPTTSSQG